MLTATALGALLLASPQAPPASKTVEPQVVSVTAYQNGYAFVTRRIPFEGTNEVLLKRIPLASAGTLLALAESGDSLVKIQTVDDPGSSTPNLGDWASILAANVGHEVKITRRIGTKYEEIRGKILSVSGNIVYLESGGATRLVAIGNIEDLQSDDKDFQFRAAPAKMFQFTKRKSGGWLTLVSLEKGFGWNLSYALETEKEKEFSLLAHATVVNNLVNLTGQPVSLAAGPIQFSNINSLDPLSAAVEMLPALRNMMAYGGGGFGGGIDFVSYDPSDNSLAQAPAPAMYAKAARVSDGNVVRTEGENVADLTFYRLGNTTLPKSDRVAKDLFRLDGDYKRIFVWRVSPTTPEVILQRINPPQPPQEEFRRIFSFKNTGPVPIAKGDLTLLEEGELVGKAEMPYVAVGEEAEVDTGSAPDLVAESFDELLNREARVETFSSWGYDRYTVKGTLRVTNRRKESSTVRIEKSVEGTVASTEGSPETRKGPNRLGSPNPITELKWRFDLAPGETKTLSYTYSTLVRS